MRGDGVGELAGILDLVDRDQHLRRDLLVELDVLLELADDRAGQRLDLLLLARLLRDRVGIGLEEVLVLGKAHDARALAALDQHLDGAVGQLQELQHGADRADGVDVGGRRIVLGRVLLRRPAGSAYRPSSRPRAPAPTFRVRRRAGRSCAGTPRCRAAAGRGRGCRVEFEHDASWLSRPPTPVTRQVERRIDSDGPVKVGPLERRVNPGREKTVNAGLRRPPRPWPAPRGRRAASRGLRRLRG